MPKYWVKNYFTHGRFPEVGQKQKTERKKTSEKSPFFLKKIKFTPKKYFFLHISSSYASILGAKLFRTWEILRSGSKAKNGKKKKKKERKKD